MGKRGLVFDGKMRDEWTKSGSIVCKESGDKMVGARVNGKYWMYFRDSKFLIAESDDLLHWKTVEDEKGIPKSVVKIRAGKFDSDLIEPGPQAILKSDGILLLFNGVNAKTGGDPSLPPRTFSSRQMLFSADVPTTRSPTNRLNWPGRWGMYVSLKGSFISKVRITSITELPTPRLRLRFTDLLKNNSL